MDRRDQGWEWRGFVRGLRKQCWRSCRARCTISLPMQVPFILPIRSGCAFKNSGCFILSAEAAGLFYFSSWLRVRVREEEVTVRLSRACKELSCLLPDRSMRFFSLLTRLSPARPSLKPELLLVWLPLFSRCPLCTIEKILASLRLGVLPVCQDWLLCS